MINSSYFNHVDRIIKDGLPAAPRGLAVRELFDVDFSFSSCNVPRRRGLNLALGFMEMCQLIGGVFDREAIAAVAPKAQLDLFSGQSAYGPRVRDQIPPVIQELVDDPSSRRATLIIANQREVDAANTPCTLTYQFHLRDKVLNASVFMRSSDAIWGLPYDVVQFGGLLQAVASAIVVRPGWITIHIGNAHVYDSTMHLRPTIEESSWERATMFTLPAAAGADPLTRWYHAREWALEFVRNDHGAWDTGVPLGMGVMSWPRR